MMPDVFPLFPSFQDRYVARAYICGAIAKVSSCCINRSTCSRNPVLLPFVPSWGAKQKNLSEISNRNVFTRRFELIIKLFVLRSTTDVKRIIK